MFVFDKELPANEAKEAFTEYANMHDATVEQELVKLMTGSKAAALHFLYDSAEKQFECYKVSEQLGKMDNNYSFELKSIDIEYIGAFDTISEILVEAHKKLGKDFPSDRDVVIRKNFEFQLRLLGNER